MMENQVLHLSIANERGESQRLATLSWINVLYHVEALLPVPERTMHRHTGVLAIQHIVENGIMCALVFPLTYRLCTKKLKLIRGTTNP